MLKTLRLPYIKKLMDRPCEISGTKVCSGAGAKHTQFTLP